jgi:hypothetical protein
LKNALSADKLMKPRQHSAAAQQTKIHTALMGVWVYVLTFFQYLLNGRALSREKAKMTLEAPITTAEPAKRKFQEIWIKPVFDSWMS